MTFEIEVKVQFRSGHRLIEPYKGKCNNLHGEGYTAIAIFSDEYLDNSGLAIDFKVVKGFIKLWIDENWDHAYIHNAKDPIGKYLKDKGLKTFAFNNNPTAEIMAEHLYNVLKKQFKIKKVGIIESFEDSIAWYQE